MKIPGQSTIVVILIGLFLWAPASFGAADSFREPHYKGKPLSEWVSELQAYPLDEANSLPPPDAEAVVALRTIGAAGIPYLLKWLAAADGLDLTSSPSPAEAVQVFRVLGVKAEFAIPDLAQIARSSAQSVLTNSLNIPAALESGRFEDAVQALAGLGPEAVPVVLGLSTNLPTQDLRVRLITRIGDFGPDGAAAAPALVQWFRSDDAQTQEAALSSLISIGQEPGIVLPILRASLRDADKREDAIYSAADYGKAAKPLIPELIKLLDDPEWRIKAAALTTLGIIGEQGDAVVPALEKQLQNSDASIRLIAASALGDFGGKSAFDALLKATDDFDDLVSEEVFKSLRKIDAKALERSGKKQRPKTPRPSRIQMIG